MDNIKGGITQEIIDSAYDSENRFDLDTFYDNVAKYFNIPCNSESNFDCKKISISTDIQHEWIEKCRQIYKNSKDSEMGLLLLLLISGPKTPEELNGYEVEIEDGFVFEEEE